MLTPEQTLEFAGDWISAWNAHDLEQIMGHYAENVVLISPIAAKLLNRPDGKVSGKNELREYFRKGLEAYPNLRFELIEVLAGLESVVLYYANQKETHSAEFMQFDDSGLVCRVLANYTVSPG
ncbi:MAG: nuclear transport factor 2 family protein [Xenococcaceae cyanobacterium]